MQALLVTAYAGLFCLVMFCWPRIGTYIVLGVTMLWPAYVVLGLEAGGPGINPQRLLVPLACAIWLLHILAVRDCRQSLRLVLRENIGIGVLIIVFFGLGVLSGLLSPFDKRQAIWGSLNQIMFIPTLMIFVLTYFQKRRSIDTLLGLILVIAIVAQVVGGIEWYMQEVVFQDLVAPSSEHAERILEGKLRLEKHRVTSVFDNPLSYAQFLVFVAPLTAYFLIWNRRAAWRVLACMQLAAIPFAVWTTGSRTGLVLIAITYLAAFIVWLQRAGLSKGLKIATTCSAVTSASLLGVFVLVQLGIDGVLGGSQSIESSTAARFVQLALGIPAIMQSPVYGVGVHQGTNFMGGLTSIDNYYLTVALEKGMLGIFVLLLIQLTILLKLYLSTRRTTSGTVAELGKLLFISYAGLYIFELTLSVVEVFTVSYVVFAAFLMLDHANAKSHQRA